MSEDIRKSKDLFDMRPADLENALQDLKRAEIFEATGGNRGVLGIFNGQVFTAFSRGDTKQFSVRDYKLSASTTPIRVASSVIFDNAKQISEILSDEPVDFTILYVENNSNISSLWFDEGSDVGQELNKKLRGKKYPVSLEIPSSIDGNSMSTSAAFLKVSVSPPKHLLREATFLKAVTKCIGELRDFLSADSSLGTIRDVLDERVSSDDTVLRDEKDQANADYDALKLVILQELADAAGLETSTQDFLVVLTKTAKYLIHNPESVSLAADAKAPERAISGSILTTAETALSVSRGGIVGNMYIRIAELLGNKELAVVRNIRKAMGSGSRDEILATFAKRFREPRDFIAIRTKIILVVKATMSEVDKYVSSVSDQEVLNKTKLAAAESKEALQKLLSSVKQSTTFAGLISDLYGRFADEQETKYSAESKVTDMSTNLIRSIMEETSVPPALSAGTSSNDIAPIEMRGSSKRMIIKRKRNPNVVKPKFVRPDKNAQIAESSVNRKDSDGTDAGKNDTTVGGGDVKFSLMRNSINAKGDDISGSDVADYLERAGELNDEVDTVAFGLETSDNEIVKVYVNAQQADDFEAEMQNLLGVEDDIENAINTLVQKFDIVDVVWPETDEVEGESEDEEFDILADEFGDDEFDDLSVLPDEDEFVDANDDSAYDKI